MARYWVGGTGTWDSADTTHWATASAGSGGVGGASVPTSTDDVFFDASSGGGTVTCTGTRNARNIDFTGFTGSVAGSGLTIALGPTVNLGTTAASLSALALQMQPSAAAALTTNGKTFSSFVASASTGITVTLNDAVTVTGAFSCNSGNFDTGSFAISCGTFNSNTTNTRVLTFGSSSITVTGTGTAWNAAATGLTISTNTATVTFTGAGVSPSFGGGVNYNGTSLVFTGSGVTSTNASSATFGNFTRTGTAVKTDGHNFLNNQTYTGTVTFNGNSSTNRLFIGTSIVGTQRSVTAAATAASNSDFMDINGQGAASWNFSAATGGSGDAGGNSGITFTTAQTNYWVGGAGNWSNVGKWASTSGGVGSTGRVPLPQDTARIDANSSSGAQTITMDMPRQAKDVDFTGAVTGLVWTLSIASTLYGSLTLSSAMTWTAGSLAVTFAGRGTHTITSAGKSSSAVVTINSVGGSYTLQDAFSTGSAVTLTSGTLDTGSMALTCLTFTSTGSTTRALTLGSSTVSLTGASSTLWNVVSTGLTLSAASSTIVFTTANVSQRNFTGGGLTYGTLTYTVAASTGILLIQGSNTFGTLNVSGGARTLTLTSATTTTVATWNVFGVSGAVVTVNSSTAASAATLNKSSAGNSVSDFLSLQDISATPATSTWYATNSTNVSGNSGWTFGSPILGRYWVGGTGTWDGTTTTNWATSSGGLGGATVPTVTDDVYFDANSGTGTVTATSSVVSLAQNLTCTGFTGTLTGTAQVTASTALSAGGTYTGFSVVETGSGSATFTSAGKQIANLTAQAGTLTLADALNVSGTFTLTSGAFTTNNFAVTCGTFSSSNSNTRTLTLGSSAITITGGNNAWLVSNATGLTFTANTAVVTMTSGLGGFNHVASVNGLSLVWTANTNGNIANPLSGALNVTITSTAAKTNTFGLFANIAMTGTFTVNGNSTTNRLLVQSSVIGTTRTVTAAAVSASNVDFADITGAGAASWNLSAITGGSGDAGGNSGITFTTAVTRYAVVAGNWSSTATWSTASGGAGGASVPLPQDTVILDASSAAGSYTMDMPRAGAAITATAFTRTLVLGTTGNFGSFTLGAGLTLGGGGTYTFGGRGTHTIDLAGKSWPNTTIFAGADGSYTLLSAFSSTASINVNNGTFVTGGFAVSCTIFGSVGTTARGLTLGTSTVSLTATTSVVVWNVAATGLTLSAASSTIVLATASSVSRFFGSTGGPQTYGTLTYTVAASTGALSITNASQTFGTLNVSGGARTLLLLSGGTTTVTNWNVFGTVGAVVTVNSSTAASAATISKTSGYIASDYVSVQDITGAVTGATYYMGSRSTNVSGNTGLSFTDAPQRFWVGGAATWNATNTANWAVVSGGTGGLSVPTNAIDVTFDANSGGGSISLVAGGVCVARNFDTTTATTTFATGTIGIGVYGTTCIIGSGVTMVGPTLSLLATSGTVSLTTNGRPLGSLSIGSAVSTAVVSLQDAVNVTSAGGNTGALVLAFGTLQTNNFAVTCGSFSSANSNTRALTLGSSSITITGSAGWSSNPSTGMTFTANTSVITLIGASAGVACGVVNWNGASFVFTGSGLMAFAPGTTSTGIANVTRTGTATKTDGFAVTNTFTISGTYTFTGNSTINRMLVSSGVVGTSRTLTAAAVVASNADFMDITGAGAASWNLSAISGLSGDAGGNSGITFTTAAPQTWQGTAGGNWSDVTKWTSRIPLPQDNVVISTTFIAGQTVTADMPRIGKDIDFSGLSGAPTWAYVGNTAYGSVTLSTALAVAGSSGFTFAGRGSHTITSAGKAFNSAPSWNGPGGTYTLVDAFIYSGGGTVTINAGTLNANGMSLTVGSLSFGSGTVTRSLVAGTSTITLNTTTVGNLLSTVSTTGLTVSAASATFVALAASISRTFGFTGLVVGTLTYTAVNSPGALVIIGANTFTTLNVGSGRTLTLPSSTTTTVTNWNVAGQDFDYLNLSGVAGSYVSTPDSVALSIVGDIDVRCRIALSSWASTYQGLVAKWNTVSNQRSWVLAVDATGRVHFEYSTTGADDNDVQATALLGLTAGAVKWIRATRARTTGVVTFYTSDDGSTWTQLGSTVTSLAGSAIFDSTTEVSVGAYTGGTAGLATGQVYRAQILNGIGGTAVLDVDFAAMP